MNKFYIYKFFEKEEYRNAFLSGLLYANKLSYYREQESKAMGVNDIFENAEIISIADDKHFVRQSIIQNNGHAWVRFDSYESIPADYRDNQAFISYNKRDYNVFCAATIIVDEQNNIVKFDKRNKFNFGEYGVIIKDTAAFLKRIKNSININENISYLYADFVKYVEYEKRGNVQRWSPFMKFSCFEEQQEWRIIFDAKTDDALNYNVGDLHDICCSIEDKDTFFDLLAEEKPFP